MIAPLYERVKNTICEEGWYAKDGDNQIREKQNTYSVYILTATDHMSDPGNTDSKFNISGAIINCRGKSLLGKINWVNELVIDWSVPRGWHKYR